MKSSVITVIAQPAPGEGAADSELQPMLDDVRPAPPLRRSSGSALRAWSPKALVKNAVYRATLFNLFLILCWYFMGTLLSLWNKLLLGKGRGLFGHGEFPAPFMMSGLQFFCQHLIARLVLALGLFKRKTEGQLTWREYLIKVVPNGMATGLDIGFSNYSLVFITLSFYVMCKSTTPLFLLAFAIAWGVEQPSWQLAGVVAVITTGLLLLVAGEAQFNLIGFVLVMTAAMLSGLRWTITQVLLQGRPGASAAHGSPVEILYQLTPVMGLTLMLISLAFERLWAVLPPSPYFSSAWHCLLTALIIFFGGVIAFLMVLAEFTLIAKTSALTFMVAGTFKEIVTVGAAVVFLHEEFTWVNALGLVVLVCGVLLFNYWKWTRLQGPGVPIRVPISGHLRHTDVEEADAGDSASAAQSRTLADGQRMGSEVELHQQQQQHMQQQQQKHLQKHSINGSYTHAEQRVLLLHDEDLQEDRRHPSPQPRSPRRPASANGSAADAATQLHRMSV